MSKRPGFSIYELMISVAILMLISTAAVVNLRATRMKDELNTAVRLVSADLRALQSRALSGSNINSCTDSDGKLGVCEMDASFCAGSSSACTPKPPYAVGAFLERNANNYRMFADVEPTKNDWKYTDTSETFDIRYLERNGAPNVTISDLLIGGSSVNQINVAFQRQNGSMGIEGCYAPCASPTSLTITLKHKISSETKNIYLNSYTGRISTD